MEKMNIDWSNLGFGYHKTELRYVANYSNGAWDEGGLTDQDMITMSECAGVLQYAQTCFEGMKAYTTEDGKIVCFRPDLNASRMADSCLRIEYNAKQEYAPLCIGGKKFLHIITKMRTVRNASSSGSGQSEVIRTATRMRISA